MTEQIWAIGGVVAGILATGGMNVVSERVKLKLGDRAAARSENRKRCQELLASIESELAGALAYEEQHGVMPIDNGYNPSDAAARAHLTEVELHCPEEIRKTALDLINKLEGHIWSDVSREDYVQPAGDSSRPSVVFDDAVSRPALWISCGQSVDNSG
ncbi:hypothetical protein QFZ30_002494 [Arthrobacter pascens]|uniref:hypothetical protein n=1 Tax=Arthrobacter pascens TaxID=1677 RepID=UPI002793755E|nr:hypothetical protein [Arthrobacter pascens]MDQ0679112.1 hypothetical protein [Arthrobacter pascens]